MEEFDLAIVGGGVAASAALIALRDASLSVAVVCPRPTNTRCRIGEHLSAGANTILKDLGLWKSFQDQRQVETHSSFSAWGSEQLVERNSITDPRGAGWCLDRPRFETWLREEARARRPYTTIEGEIADVEIDPDSGAKLSLKSGDFVRARFILDASGRAAAIAKRFTQRSRMDRLVATYHYYSQIDAGIEPTSGALVEAMPDGWFYSAILPERRLIAAWFTDGDLLAANGREDLAANWCERVRSSEYTRRRIATAGYSLENPEAKKPATTDAATCLNESVVGVRWAAVGDAAAAFDPLSSHGLTTALWAGRRAGQAVAHWLNEGEDARELKSYQEAYLGGMRDYRTQSERLYSLERRFDTAFWRRRNGAARG